MCVGTWACACMHAGMRGEGQVYACLKPMHALPALYNISACESFA